MKLGGGVDRVRNAATGAMDDKPASVDAVITQNSLLHQDEAPVTTENGRETARVIACMTPFNPRNRKRLFHELERSVAATSEGSRKAPRTTVKAPFGSKLRLESRLPTSSGPMKRTGNPAANGLGDVISISSGSDDNEVVKLESDSGDDSQSVLKGSRKRWNQSRAKGKGTCRTSCVDSFIPSPPAQQSRSNLEPRGPLATLGRLEGQYRVLCSSISAYGGNPCDLGITLTVLNNIIYGAFDFGPIHGYLRTKTVPLPTSQRRLTFQWRGVDDRNRVYNREEDGSALLFYGNGGIRGTLIWPNVEQQFEALRISPPGDRQVEDVLSASMIDEQWNKLDIGSMR